MLKRVGLFIITNLLVMIAASFLINVIFAVFGIKSGNWSSLMVICLVWGMMGSMVSLFISKWMAKRMMGLQVVDENDFNYRDLVDIVHTLSKKAGIEKMPEVCVYQSVEMNAFATGYSKNNSLVAVSSGILTGMNRDELEAVIGHELSHVANGDMVTMALVQGVVNAFVMFFSRVVASMINNALRSDDEGEGLGGFSYFIVVMLLDFLFGILASPIVMTFSRFREYRADAGSAYLVGKEKMIMALRKLGEIQQIETSKHSEKAIAVMQINNTRRSWIELFSTHPSIEKRILKLQNM